MRYLALGAALMTVVCGQAFGGPLRSEFVKPEATWVMHLDAEGLQNTTLGRLVLDGGLRADIEADMPEFAAELGINPLRDIKSVTLFGEGTDEHRTLVIVETTDAIDNAIGKLETAAPGYSAISDNGRTVHSWDMNDHRMYAYTTRGAAPGERWAMFCADLDELRTGMLRMEVGGRDFAPILEQSPPTAGAVVYVSGEEIPGLNDPHASQFLRFARQVSIQVGEWSNELRLDARLVAASREDATTLLQLGQGLMALGRLASSGEDPNLAPLKMLLDGAKAEQENSDVRFSLRVPVGELAGLLARLSELHSNNADDEAQPEGEDEEEVKIRATLKEVKKSRTERPAREKSKNE